MTCKELVGKKVKYTVNRSKTEPNPKWDKRWWKVSAVGPHIIRFYTENLTGVVKSVSFEFSGSLFDHSAGFYFLVLNSRNEFDMVNATECCLLEDGNDEKKD